MKKIKVIIVGAGMRGMTYASYAQSHPEELEVVAVAEPVDDKRNHMQSLYHLPDSVCFRDWRDLLELPKMADAAVIATMDDMHFEPAMEAIKKKYHLLLEKPIAPTAEECVAISKAAEENQVHVVVCHVLRYSPFYKKLKEILASGVLGRVVSIVHTEGVGNIHQSHSFVRGNWRNSKETAPMILAKSCHDMDLLQWLFDKPCQKVQSFGALTYFNSANRPEGAPERCIDGCPVADTCCYNAVKLYLDDKENDWFRGVATQKVNPTDADVEQALRTGPYGRCVFCCDNDVVDHQTVNLVFSDNATAVFTMCAFTEGGRQLRIMGTKGELFAKDTCDEVTIYEFATGEKRTVKPVEDMQKADITGGHGGGDTGIMEAFCALLRNEYTGNSLCGIDVSCRNHLMAFAAEKSRLSGEVVDLDRFEESLSV